MTSCPSCGAHTPAGASWCGQCYQPLSVAPAAAVPGQVGVEAAFGAAGSAALDGPERFGIFGPPVPPANVGPDQALDAGTPNRFGLAGAPTAVGTIDPPTWTPSRAPQPPVTPPAPPTSGVGHLGSWASSSIGATVIGAILLGGVLQLVFYAIGRNGHIEPEAFVRYAIVGTVAFYCVVAVVIIHRVHMRGVRLMWTQGNPRVSAAIGAGVGVALGGGMVALISASQGHLATDANAQLIASEGDIAHLAALVLITMLAAPLVEETLFRGLFAESMRARGVATAVWTSAIAFAFWHWPILNASTPAFIVQTIYYTLMGAMFARLYWRGGLVRSMSAHAGFNGALTVAAIALALSPGHVIHGDGYQFSAPRGWHQPSHQQGSLGGAVLLVGPSDASVFVDLEPTFGLGRNVTADDLVARFSSGQLNGFDGLGDIVGRPTEERLPAGEAVEVDLNVRGHTGALVMLPTSQGVVIVGFGSGGSARADHDFQQMLQSLRIT